MESISKATKTAQDSISSNLAGVKGFQPNAQLNLAAVRPLWHEMSDNGNAVLVKNYEPELGYDKETEEAIQKIDWRAGKFIKNKLNEGNEFKPGDIVYHKGKQIYVSLEKPEGKAGKVCGQ